MLLFITFIKTFCLIMFAVHIMIILPGGVPGGYNFPVFFWKHELLFLQYMLSMFVMLSWDYKYGTSQYSKP